jgi:hypothetical protein
MFDAQLGTVTSVTELLAPPSQLQAQPSVTGKVKAFSNGLGGVAPEYGLSIEFSVRAVTTEVTVRRTEPALGEPSTVVDVSVEVPFSL